MKQIIILGIIGNIIFLGAFLFGYHFFYIGKYQGVKVLREDSGYTYINPLLECNVEFVYYNPKNLQNELKEYIENTIETTAVIDASYYVRLLNNGATFGYQEETEYIPASLIKLPLAIAFLKHTSLKHLKDTIIVKEDEADVLHRNFGKDTIQVGVTYTFSQLFEAMLKISDNNAAFTIINDLGFDPIYRVYKEFGLENIDFSDLGSINISAKAYASFFRMLYNASYIPREDSEYILSLLVQGNFKTGLAALLPGGVPVANKFGERKNPLNNETQLHDCGIVYAKNTPYVLCIMTRGADFDEQLKMIQQISKKVYDTVSSSI